MQAVFVHRDCLLRDSYIEPSAPPEGWRLMPASAEAMRLLATPERMVFIYGRCCDAPEDNVCDQVSDSLVHQIASAGGRVDAVLTCTHQGDDPCHCWGSFPGLLLYAASEFAIELNESYLLGDGPEDVQTAYAAGVRPIVVLANRSLGALMGDLPAHKDYPIAMDLTMAQSYIAIEEEIRQQLQHPRGEQRPLPAYSELYAQPAALPTVRAISPMAQGQQSRLSNSRVARKDMLRWLSLFVLGALGLSLGVAYMLTHLYRVQPFPEFVYYITLQFISRPLRGALFIVVGAIAIALTMRSLVRSAKTGLWRKS